MPVSCKNGKNSWRHVLMLLLTATLLGACSDSSDSPESQIRAFLDAAVEAGESRSIDGISELIHADFIDQQGRNLKQLSLLLRGYFLRHKSIHLFTRIESIEILGENRASVSLYVAMAGTAISDVNALSSLSARLYRFELQLLREDDWLLQHASWAPADISAFE